MDTLLYKLKSLFPPANYLIIKLYLTEHHFKMRYDSALSNLAIIIVSVPAFYSPFSLFCITFIFLTNQPLFTSVADYFDDKAFISINNDPFTAFINLQYHLAHMKN